MGISRLASLDEAFESAQGATDMEVGGKMSVPLSPRQLWTKRKTRSMSELAVQHARVAQGRPVSFGEIARLNREVTTASMHLAEIDAAEVGDRETLLRMRTRPGSWAGFECRDRDLPRGIRKPAPVRARLPRVFRVRFQFKYCDRAKLCSED
jgi:hypothetical protein